MNDTPIKRSSDDTRAVLLEVCAQIKGNLSHVEKCLGMSKDVLKECCSALEELHSQIAVFETIVKETTSTNIQQPLDPTEFVRRTNLLKEASDQETIEVITVEGDEKLAHPTSALPQENFENKKKKQKTILKENEPTPGFSGETAKIIHNNPPLHPDEQSGSDKEFDNTLNLDYGVTEIALQKSPGVLSTQEFKTFLRLSDQVQDPVQLAKVAFTRETKKLYFQLSMLHFHLKIRNDVFESRGDTSITNRALEGKVLHLVHKFQPEGENPASTL